MAVAKGTRHSKTPCSRCGRRIATTALAQYNHARACKPHASACGCTQTARCPDAHALHRLWWERGADDSAFVAYRTHLRQAGVTPGQARWEEEV